MDQKRYYKQKKINLYLYIITRIIVLFIMVYSTYKMIVIHTDEYESHYAFIMTQSFFLLFNSFLPMIIEKKWKVEIPELMEFLFIIFCIGSLLIGSIGRMYSTVTWWDDLMHTMSGALITTFAFSLINLINKKQNLHLELNPLFVVMFAFCFALTIGVMWEIIEFINDFIKGGNMQKHTNPVTKIPLQGNEALKDTMTDFILDSVGALLVSLIGYLNLTKKRNLALLIETKEDFQKKL